MALIRYWTECCVVRTRDIPMLKYLHSCVLNFGKSVKEFQSKSARGNVFTDQIKAFQCEGQAIHIHWALHLHLLCQDYSIHSILIFILVPVSSMWIWSSLCLWMSWPSRCQVIPRSGSDHPNGYFFVRISQHSICTLMSTIICVSCIWIWSSLCLWMSWPRRCQTIHRLRSDHWILFVKIPVSTDSLKNIIVSISYIWN